jgi:hypothetical protein
MNQRNLIIGAIVIVGAYFVYKKYYTKKPLPIKPLPIKPILDDKGNPVLPINPILDDKGNPIAPKSSFDSYDFNDELMPLRRNRR